MMMTMRRGETNRHFFFILLLIFFCLFLKCPPTIARIHHLSLTDDTREQITISTFGYLKNGFTQVNVIDLSFNPLINLESVRNSFAFIFEKVKNGGFSSFTEDDKKQDFCSMLRKQSTLLANNTNATANPQNYFSNRGKSYSLVLLELDLITKKARIVRIGNDLKDLKILNKFQSTNGFNTKYFNIFEQNHPKPPSSNNNNSQQQPTMPLSTSELDLPFYDEYSKYIKLNSLDLNVSNKSSVSFKFEIAINSYNEEGLYILNFFNCFQQHLNDYNREHSIKQPMPDQKLLKLDIQHDEFLATFYNEPKFGINLELDLVERNEGSYLSAGDMPVPTLYFTWSIIYFLGAISWMYILKGSKGDVYKLHYLMLALVFIKSISLTFHAINMHYIAVNGRHEAIWAILYYITYVLRGLLLIVSIILVGTGWTFVKRILTENERRLFVIVIPLQILAITAYIFLEEKEEGDAVYLTWRQLFLFVDLICCGSILFPVVWSIKHLEAATRTDEKMMTNLKKLRIFKHFYIMVICYIYFTRIIGYLLKQILPFRYVWFDELCTELVTFTFFAMTAYKFQPASNNPYLQLNQQDEDLTSLNSLINEETGGGGADSNQNQTDIIMDLTAHDYKKESSSSSRQEGVQQSTNSLASSKNVFSRNKQIIPSTQL